MKKLNFHVKDSKKMVMLIVKILKMYYLIEIKIKYEYRIWLLQLLYEKL
jgi:hypothetical protein